MCHENSRVAFSGIVIIKTKKYFFFWLMERVACAAVEIKDQVALTFKLASNDFACLKRNRLIWMFRNGTNGFKILPGVYKNFLRSTRTRSSMLPHNHSEPVCQCQIQKPNLRLFFLNEVKLISKFYQTQSTVEVNDEWFVIRIDSTKNKNCIPRW